MVLSLRRARMNDSEDIAELLTQLEYPTDPAARIVGVAHLHVAPPLEHEKSVGQLAALGVDRRSRGSGVGRALIRAVEEAAHRGGCGVLFVTTALRRAEAHAFYEGVGFDFTGRRYMKGLEE